MVNKTLAIIFAIGILFIGLSDELPVGVYFQFMDWLRSDTTTTGPTTTTTEASTTTTIAPKTTPLVCKWDRGLKCGFFHRIN